MSTNKKAYVMPPSRHGHFHSILDGQVTAANANTTVHWL